MTRLALLATLGLLAVAVAIACSDPQRPTTSPLADDGSPVPAAFADVVAAEVSGAAGAYSFAVTVRSPDTGCDQFADWWEVSTESGDLLYRRVLLHSHVGEQPFVRNGGPVEIASDAVVIVRAHMNTGGYGGAALRGSPAAGFEAFQTAPGFGAPLASIAPLPDGCAF